MTRTSSEIATQTRPSGVSIRESDGERPASSLIRKVDLCRGLLAFLVVAAHAFDVCNVIHHDQIAALPGWVRHVLGSTLQSGCYWVMGFFVISGYCIQLSVGRMLAEGRFPLNLYLVARFTRIIPLYYAGLIFAVVIELGVGVDRPDYYPDGLNPLGFLSQLVFLQRFVVTFGSFAPSWTITNELFYYLFFGLLATLAGGRQARPAWVGMGICIVLGTICQILYLAGHKGGIVLHPGLLFGFGINWFLGALVAAHRQAIADSSVARWVSIGWPLVFLSAVAMHYDGRFKEQVIALMIGLSFALMLVRFTVKARDESKSGRATAVSRRWASIVEGTGLASYPTYLFHGPILLLMATGLHRWDGITDWRLTWLTLVGTAIGVGVILGWFAERPIMAWRSSFLKALREAPGPPIRVVPSNTPQVQNS